VANSSKRLPGNAPGELFIEESCIDCGTCCWMAPEVFEARASNSVVGRQPGGDRQWHDALKALIACPTGSIGTERKRNLSPALAAFPDPIDGPVFNCGYHARSSFGAASYFIRRDAGNVLVDSPRFARRLVNRLEQMGGIETMFLSHRDDVADHQKFADHFGCRRIIHADDVVGGTRIVEIKIEGREPVALAGDLTIIPVPGHTRGSACLLFEDKFLFTGDHLAWNIETAGVRAFRNVCWYDWGTQIASMKRLRDYRFEWVLPGHGRRGYLAAAEMAVSLENCINWMEDTR
jgi:glyoxylase-like metal-dependent hydrolase (beta-lactamase superfamily II)